MGPQAVKLLTDGLTALADDPQMIGRLLEKLGCIPNIKMPTLGGPVFWDDLATVQGWGAKRGRSSFRGRSVAFVRCEKGCVFTVRD